MNQTTPTLPILSPPSTAPEHFSDAAQAVARLKMLYRTSVQFLAENFAKSLTGEPPEQRFRAFYPEVRITTTSYAQIDSRLAFGHVNAPGTYSATITRPDLFEHYLEQQIGLLLRNHGVPVQIGQSTTPIPVHFAVPAMPEISIPASGTLKFTMRDIFDVPDLETTDDRIVNGLDVTKPDGSGPLAPFTAQRVDYSLARLSHYTATDPDHFQNHVLFTNYQFYVDEFEAFAREALGNPDSGYSSFVGPGGQEITSSDGTLITPEKLPQIPSYHLKRAGGDGITLVNIGV